MVLHWTRIAIEMFGFLRMMAESFSCNHLVVFCLYLYGLPLSLDHMCSFYLVDYILVCSVHQNLSVL